MSWPIWAAAFAFAASLTAVCSAQESAEDLQKLAIAGYREGRLDEAFTLANQAIAVAPSDPTGYYIRGLVLENRQNHDKALADYNRVVKLSPKLPLAYSRRGALHFKRGEFAASIADFDREIELEPPKANNHWQRGISYYYAGRYQDCWKQFELSYKTVNPDDYENGIFHFLCMAREKGVEKARKSMLEIKSDSRVPMKEIYELYQGKGTIDAVMSAAETGYPNADELNDRLFYAHFYVGLYQDVLGDTEAALGNITRATENFPIAHFMWDVARIHAGRLGEQQKKGN